MQAGKPREAGPSSLVSTRDASESYVSWTYCPSQRAVAEEASGARLRLHDRSDDPDEGKVRDAIRARTEAEEGAGTDRLWCKEHYLAVSYKLVYTQDALPVRAQRHGQAHRSG